MPIWLQHLLVLLIVAGCAGYILRQAISTLRLRPGKLGNCCTKGCSTKRPAGRQGGTVHFLPVESLIKRR